MTMPDSVAISNGVPVASPARPEPAAKLPPPDCSKPATTLPSQSRSAVLRWVGRSVAAILTLAILAGGAMAFRAQQDKKANQPTSGASGLNAKAGLSILDANTVSVTPDVTAALGIRTAEVAPADRPRPLPPLQGVLNVDLNRMVPVHSPFAGLVVAIGTVDGGETDRPAGDTGARGLRHWDTVKANQLLAVVWSKDLGEKKSELVQAVSDLRLARDQLNRYQSLTEGIIAQKEVRAAEGAVRSAENAVGKAEATLRAWRLPDAEIRALIAEAEKHGTPEARRELTSGKTWARVEIRAPFAGTLLEKNTNIGDVVDTTATLFRVADLSRLSISVQVYEEDLPALQALPRPIPWEVRIPARTDFRATGTLEQIGEIIDPTQHTALVNGTVDNPRGELKAGQFVTVTIAVPPQPGEVVVPTAALVEDGKSSIVFVQPDAASAKYVRRAVTVTRRYHDVCFVRGGSESVRAGDRVVTGGALQLNQALTDAPPTAVAHK
jgi:membrane fusion protein, heavy metal efflux system